MMYVIILLKLILLVCSLFFVAFQFKFWHKWFEKQSEVKSWSSGNQNDFWLTMQALGGWISCSLSGLFITEWLMKAHPDYGILPIIGVVSALIMLTQICTCSETWDYYQNNFSQFDLFELELKRWWFVLALLCFFGLAFLYGELDSFVTFDTPPDDSQLAALLN